MPEMVADTYKHTVQKDHWFRASLGYVVTLSLKKNQRLGGMYSSEKDKLACLSCAGAWV